MFSYITQLPTPPPLQMLSKAFSLVLVETTLFLFTFIFLWLSYYLINCVVSIMNTTGIKRFGNKR